MALVSMRPLLEQARAQGRAVGSFSVANMEMILGTVQAAQALRTPVILQIAQVRLPTSPLHVIGAAMVAAARAASVPIAVHLDHGLSLACIEEAISLGFTSVMYDGSHLPLAENIRNTREIARMAHTRGVEVEAEIGRVGRGEDGSESESVCADPQEAILFARETRVDALAVAYGNAHGVYVGTPSLRFDVLEAIGSEIDTPLVLHGGTGLSQEDFDRSIALGVRKINVATACFQAAAGAAGPGCDIFALSRAMTESVAKAVEAHIRRFGQER